MQEGPIGTPKHAHADDCCTHTLFHRHNLATRAGRKERMANGGVRGWEESKLEAVIGPYVRRNHVTDWGGSYTR